MSEPMELAEVNGTQVTFLDEKLDKLARKRVKRGIRLLDKKYPGWPALIQLHDHFDLGSSSRCVLGQLGPDLVMHLHGGERDIDNTYNEASEALFDIPNKDRDEQKYDVAYGFVQDGLVSYRRLNNVWEYYIGRRQRKLSVNADGTYTS